MKKTPLGSLEIMAQDFDAACAIADRMGCEAFLLNLEGEILKASQPRCLNSAPSSSVRERPTWLERLSPPSAAHFRQLIHKAVQTGQPQKGLISDADLAHDVRLGPILNGDNEVLGLVVLAFRRDEPESELTLYKTRYENLVQSIPSGVYVFSSQPNGHHGFDYLSPKATELLGVPVCNGTLNTEGAFACVHRDDQTSLQRAIHAVLKNPRNFDWVGRFVVSGESRWLRINGNVMEPSTGRLVWNGVIQDITEQIRTRRILEASEERYRRLFEIESDAILLVDLEAGRFIDANPGATRLYGYSRDEFLTRGPADLTAETEKTTEAIRTQQNVVALRWHRKRDGTAIAVEISCDYFEAESKRLLVATIRDLTQRREAEYALRESEERLRFTLDSTEVGQWELDWNSRTCRGSQQVTRIFGYPDSVHPWTYEDFLRHVHPKDASWVDRSVRTAMESNTGWELEFRIVRADQAVRWVWVKAALSSRHGSKPNVANGLFMDVTQRKEMEAALREGQSRFEALFDQNLLGVVQVQTSSGRFLRVNQQFCDILGEAQEALLKSSFLSISHPEDANMAREAFARFAAGENEHSSFEKRYLRKDGSIVWCSLRILPLWLRGETPDSHLCFFEDITERRHLEEQLRYAQKMEGIGHLAGGMAHEFNNILAGMMMSVGLAQNGSIPAETQELMQDVEFGCKRAADLIKQLLAFSRKSVMEQNPLDLATAVRSQLPSLRQFLNEKINFICTIPEGLPLIRGDRSLIEQVVQNLFLNARDAMKDGGQLEIELCELTLGPDITKQQVDARPGHYVCLAVSDTGCGMDSRTLKRAFEPFFTTKDVGEGTGLGLATVRGIVQQHQGWVAVQSCIGKGSTFRVYLPVLASVLEAPHASPELLPGDIRGTILVVEDEPKLRRVTRMFLSQSGYRVLDAENGAEALELWEKHRSAISLIYTDMIMPGEFSGLQLALRAIREKPGLPVIITSGYNTDLVQLEKAATASILYLPKPCAPLRLLAAIRQSLSDARTTTS